ncbi:isochorismate synthase, chloroplastic [Tanacetum coccineum]
MSMPVQMSQAQDGERPQVDDQRLNLADDLKEAQDHISSYKWVFKKKMKTDGTIDKYKARLAIKGFRQSEGLDYFDTYLPVTRITSIRMVLAIVALRKIEVDQMDVKMTFLNGDLEKLLYMNQPEGFMALD